MFLPLKESMGRAIQGVGMMAGLFYVSGWLTTQLLIRRKNPVLFVLFAIFLIIIFSYIKVEVLHLFPWYLAKISGQLPNDFFQQRDNLFLGRNLSMINRFGTVRAPYFVSLLMNSVILIIAVLFRLYEHKAEKELENREKLQKNQEAQILYLKSQVNPHFLFNTLNNLYGLTYSKSDLAPRMVLGLSDTMRYLIYETEQKLVPVEKELNFIRNYLDLEKMRISYPESIRISTQVKQPSAFIPPLLLLPFVENCFKHGTIGKEEDGWMELDIWDDHHYFYFVCKNNFRENMKISGINGIGLTNVKQRLDLIFGEKYELRTVKQHEEYMVSLQFPFFLKKNQL